MSLDSAKCQHGLSWYRCPKCPALCCGHDSDRWVRDTRRGVQVCMGCEEDRCRREANPINVELFRGGDGVYRPIWLRSLTG